MEGVTDRAGDCLGWADCGTNGDCAHEYGSEQCNDRLLELRLARHLKTPFFSPALLSRVDAGYNSSAVPIPQNCEKLHLNADFAGAWEVSPTKTW
ncbi:MAG: hypothetical protein H0V46_03810 [Sphingomonas sp.]|nr:hypothetical protein [Sphingomonas sp.]